MARNIHRDSADAQRAAAHETDLPNVRERNLRSAAAHDALAAMEEKTAAASKERADLALARMTAMTE